MEQWREELYQSGIKGQKWGTRHGPPYPLEASDYTAKQRKENPGLFAKLKRKAEQKKTQKAKDNQPTKPLTNAQLKRNIERDQLETLYLKSSAEKRKAIDDEANYELQKLIGDAKMKNEYNKVTKGTTYDDNVKKVNNFLAATASTLAIGTTAVALISSIRKLKQTNSSK